MLSAALPTERAFNLSEHLTAKPVLRDCAFNRIERTSTSTPTPLLEPCMWHTGLLKAFCRQIDPRIDLANAIQARGAERGDTSSSPYNLLRSGKSAEMLRSEGSRWNHLGNGVVGVMATVVESTGRIVKTQAASQSETSTMPW